MAATLTPERAREDQSDTDLVAAVRTGDDDAFAALYARYHEAIVRFAHGMVRDWARAEDVSQEVFISALRRIRETERPINFRPWVYEIARNACIDHFRRSKRAEELSIDGGALRPRERAELADRRAVPERAVEVGEQMDHLRGAFGGLSDNHHRILVLRELEGLSYREIGERMGMTRPSVESTLFRARRRLGEEYADVQTGRRCNDVREALGPVAGGIAGVRERRRVQRHLAWCSSCRSAARHAGLESGLLSRRAWARGPPPCCRSRRCPPSSSIPPRTGSGPRQRRSAWPPPAPARAWPSTPSRTSRCPGRCSRRRRRAPRPAPSRVSRSITLDVPPGRAPPGRSPRTTRGRRPAPRRVGTKHRALTA